LHKNSSVSELDMVGVILGKKAKFKMTVEEIK